MAELRSTRMLPSIKELEGQRFLLEGQVIDVIFFSEKTGFFVSEFKPSKAPSPKSLLPCAGTRQRASSRSAFTKTTVFDKPTKATDTE